MCFQVPRESLEFDHEMTADNIKVVKGLQGLRLRPRMFIPDFDGEHVLNHFIFETLCDAIDQAVEGDCTTLDISFSKKEAIVSYDAGICLEEEFGGLTFAEGICTQLYACRDRKNHSEIGIKYCGIGLAVVNAFSENFQISTVHRGFRGLGLYRKGNSVQPFTITPCDALEQTTVSFKPDPEIFGEREFHLERIQPRIQALQNDFPALNVTVRERNSLEP
jgi:DNA gyrase/topoisomerase IV subunit B